MNPRPSRSEHVRERCPLCLWMSRTSWDLDDGRPVSALFDWAAHVRLEHPVMADWLRPGLSGTRQN